MRVTTLSRRWFLALWASLLVAKLLLAARLPLFVDEAFYWQEGRHLAWAYSDLPALTAWLARLGTALGGTHPLALRLPFLVLAAVPPAAGTAAAAPADACRRARCPVAPARR